MAVFFFLFVSPPPPSLSWPLDYFCIFLFFAGFACFPRCWINRENTNNSRGKLTILWAFLRLPRTLMNSGGEKNGKVVSGMWSLKKSCREKGWKDSALLVKASETPIVGFWRAFLNLRAEKIQLQLLQSLQSR